MYKKKMENIFCSLSICTHFNKENFNGLDVTYRPHIGNKGNMCLQPAH